MSNVIIGTITLHLSYNILFFLKDGSYVEITVGDNTYTLTCEMTYYDIHHGNFTLFSIDKKELARVETLVSFFDISTFDSFFLCSNKVDRLQHQHHPGRSVWQNKDKNNVLVLKKDTVTFNETVLTDKAELFLLVSLTLTIEELFLKKERRGLTLLLVFVAVSTILITILLPIIFVTLNPL